MSKAIGTVLVIVASAVVLVVIGLYLTNAPVTW
jgi:hypothetical protein